MVAGFFASSILARSKTPTFTQPQCGLCRLCETCHSPKMGVTGDGLRGILFVGESPEKEDDKYGSQFQGEGGQLLRSHLRQMNISLDRDCWKTNAVICRPPRGKPPTPNQVDWCRPNLLNTIKELNPRVIVPLGGYAVRSLIGHLWKEDTGPIARWVGWKIPCETLGSWLCPTYSPGYVHQQARSEALSLWFHRHLKRAVGTTEEVPATPTEQNTECVTDPEQAAKRIRQMIQRGGLCAFDYETNMIKPDGENAQIVCCSICWEGKRTISYPWMGEAVTATREFLQSDLPKIIATKFETRWSKAKVGVNPKNVVWDVVLAAHALNSMPGVAGVKFQSFVRFGVGSYDDHIKPFLKSDRPNQPNQITTKIDIRDLLKYCARDSFLEWHIAKDQMREMGV